MLAKTFRRATFELTSTMGLRAFALALGVLCFTPTTALAWKYHEHFEIGRESYRCACYWLLSEAKVETGDAASCPLTSGPDDDSIKPEEPLDEIAKALLTTIACPQSALSIAFDRYGQATALANDHLAAPADLESLEGQRDTVSFVTYALRAVEDGDHFHPRAPLMWQQHHLEALDLAEWANQTLIRPAIGRVSIDARTRKDFAKILYENAFGDHFIQDSFAAGHMGMNRGATRPTAANNFHDRQNYTGRVVRDGIGHIWRTHGDSKLHWPLSGKTEVLRAATYSVYDTLRAFVVGHRDGGIGRRVTELLPVAYCLGNACEEVERIARSTGTQGADRPALLDTPSTNWVGLQLTHTAASVIGAPGIEYRHALGERGFLRNQINVVTSFPIGSTFAFRFDVGFGVITPALRPSEATSIYVRGGLVVPLHAAYGSALTFDLALGLLNETCVDACQQAAAREGDDERGIFGGYLGPRMNLELGRIALLQAFVEPFYAADYGGNAFWGLGFGVVLSKGTKVSTPELFPGPPL